MSEHSVLLEAVSPSATMNREVWHLTYDGKKALCGSRIHTADPGSPVVRVNPNHCGNCRRVYAARDSTHDSPVSDTPEQRERGEQ